MYLLPMHTEGCVPRCSHEFSDRSLSLMSFVPSRIRTVVSWFTLLACVWTVTAVPASETVCIRGMVMRTPTCAACVHHAPAAVAAVTQEAPGGSHASMQSHCCVVRSTQVTPAVAPAAAPTITTAALVPALGAKAVIPIVPESALLYPHAASPPLPPQRNSPAILRL